jgi:hypothetical protein
MVLNLLLDECIDNAHTKVTRERRKRKETNKQRQRARSLEEDKSRTP